MVLNNKKTNMKMKYRVIRNKKIWINANEETIPFLRALYETIKTEQLKIVERNTFKTKKGLLEIIRVEKK
jgi:alpha-amylase/alpha-mannosidase (GH57 family)